MLIGYWWIISALFFLLIEMATPGLFFFVSFATGSIVASLASFYNYSLEAQCLLFLAESAFTFALIRWRFANKPVEKLTSNTQALIGRCGTVTSAIEPGKTGYVKINGDMWRALALHDTAIAPDELVRIVAIKGNTITVTRKS